jgi:prepilin-type N-terminal cleavage/methylation domain-containing protein
MRRRNGFTLPELMISSVILGILSVYLLRTFTVSEHAYHVIDQVGEVQQNMRAIADILERDIRHAGFLVPARASICLIDNTNTSDTIYLSDAGAINPAGILAPRLGSMIPGTNVTAGATVMAMSLVLETPPDPAYDTNNDGNPDSDYRVGGGIIFADINDPTRGSACGVVTAVNAGFGSITFTLQSAPLGPAGGAVQLAAVPAHIYNVDGQSRLTRDGTPLVRDIDDLQVAVFLDGNDNNVVDPGEYLGDGVGGNYVSSAVNLETAREVRVNLVSRTRTQDTELTTGRFQVTENRLAVAGTDGFRRRVHTSTGLLRNLVTR